MPVRQRTSASMGSRYLQVMGISKQVVNDDGGGVEGSF